jgi:hypothetical protein
MKKTTFALGTLITGMMFGLVLAGCATDSGGGPSAEELAAQLAEGINAIEAEKAAVSGDTVTLTGGVRLENAVLVVPSGVTLDLTKETLQLADNAIFTVNGTVNAKAQGVNIDSTAANPATINGSGTISLKSKGQLLNIEGGRKLILDGVTLAGLKDNSNSVVEIGNGGEFVLKSGAITGNARTGGNGGGVSVYKGTFTMEGGEISGNSAENGHGGGVNVAGEGSKFVMKNGAIKENTATLDGFAHGGGVHVHDHGVSFIMEGGTISGNSAKGNGADGGGVYVWETTFIMSGGIISDNSTIGNNDKAQGGGVVVATDSGTSLNDRGTFIMEGGTISGNSAIGKTMSFGGGVHIGGLFTLKGGRIQGGTDSDGFTANTLSGGTQIGAALMNSTTTTATWGTGGTYTKGGESQSGGSDIGSTDDTLIAVPAQ